MYIAWVHQQHLQVIFQLPTCLKLAKQMNIFTAILHIHSYVLHLPRSVHCLLLDTFLFVTA